MARGLGDTQKLVLLTLNDRSGTWYPGCGWLWGTVSETEKALKSLVPHGLVKVEGMTPSHYGIFNITPAGIEKAKTLKRRT